MTAELVQRREALEGLRAHLAEARATEAGRQAEWEMAQRDEKRFQGSEQELRAAAAIRERSRNALLERMAADEGRLAEKQAALARLRETLAAQNETLEAESRAREALRGRIAATLQKKMLVNTAGVLFELLGKTNDRTLITSAGSYLGGAFYQLYRALHRASGGKEGYFGLDATAYQSGAVDAQMRADYIAYVSSLAQLSEKDGAFASMEDEALASLYPGLMQSVTQVLHSTEEKTNSLLGRK